jgi:HlyD family secretion protein/macrolide-specific efflux system membrane fusion protein
LAKLRHAEALKFMLPRQEESAKESTDRVTLTAEGAKIVLPLILKKQQLDLEKMKVDRARSEKTLKELLADRESMAVSSPVDGVVYLGKFADGSFSATSAEQLQRGASLPVNKVFMTIVQPRPMVVRAETPEKDLQYVHAGLKGVARPTGYPDVKLSTTVADVADVPSAANTFDTKITIGDQDDSPLMPGMTCSVKMIGYRKKDALIVPPSALKTDPLNEEKHFVWLVGEKGEGKRHRVTVGKRTDKEVEILKGLSEGDRVLREYPKDDDKKAEKK